MSDEKKYQKGKLYQLGIDQLTPDPNQPRKHFDQLALEELSLSIKEHGVIQPILFRKDDAGPLFIVAGERRWRAAKMAGKAEISALLTDGKTAEISLIENLLRQDLTAVEEAEALQQMIEKHQYKQEDLSKIIGKALSTISEILSLNKLPVQIRDEVRANPKCSRRVLLEILRKKKQPKSIITLYEKYKQKGLIDGETVKSGVKRGPKKSYLSFIEDFADKITKMETSNIAPEDRKALKKELEDLKRCIDEKLVTISS